MRRVYLRSRTSGSSSSPAGLHCKRLARTASLQEQQVRSIGTSSSSSSSDWRQRHGRGSYHASDRGEFQARGRRQRPWERDGGGFGGTPGRASDQAWSTRQEPEEAEPEPINWREKQAESAKHATSSIASLSDYTSLPGSNYSLTSELADLIGLGNAEKLKAQLVRCKEAKFDENARKDIKKGQEKLPPLLGPNDQKLGVKIRDGATVMHDTLTPYTDFAGNRFPTLSTAKNWRYLESRGLNQLQPRKFPIHVESHLRLDPYLREYIFFLHSWDPQRFTIPRIAERYRLKEKTVVRVVKEFGLNYFLRASGMTSTRRRQIQRSARMAEKKAQAFAVAVGFDQMGDGEEDVHAQSDDFQGWKGTQDWVRRQNTEVEMMSAFPLREKRNPIPKRVDVDLVVGQTPEAKIINWIDPHDRVVF
ncbi:unnamed protein product [Amoebophrya sp. A25]|nr:unnamed protein product [Amoebophrya sp. A25]|eukprot:GSA25T00005879001.1